MPNLPQSFAGKVTKSDFIATNTAVNNVGLINVKDYASVELAVAAVTSGSTLYFPPGAYTVSATMQFTGLTDVTVMGYGATVTSSNMAAPVMRFDTCTRLNVYGINLTQSAMTTRDSVSHGLRIDTCTDATVEDVSVWGVEAAGIIVYRTPRVRIRGCMVRDNMADGIHIAAGSRWVTVSNCTTQNTGDDGLAAVTHGDQMPDQTQDVSFVNNAIFQSKARGITVVGAMRVSVVGNVIHSTKMAGIIVAQDPSYSSPACRDVVIDGNTIHSANTYDSPSGTNAGIHIGGGSATDYVEGVVISNNIIRGSRWRQVHIGGNVSDAVRNVVLHGNHIYGPNTLNSAVYSENSRDIAIVDNYITLAREYGIITTNTNLGVVIIRGNVVIDSNQAQTVGIDAIQISTPQQVVRDNVVVENNNYIERPFEVNSASITKQWFTGNVNLSTKTMGWRSSNPENQQFVQGAGDKRWTQAGAAPTAGTWAVGDFVQNHTPTSGGTFGWVCTTAGTPGTWRAIAIAAS